MTVANVIFMFFCGLTVIGAVLAVTFHRVFYNALALGVCFFGIAGIYVFLHSEFLAAFQVIVYIGAIAVAIAFAIMLSDPEQKAYPSSKTRMLLAFIVAGMIFVVLCCALMQQPWPVQPAQEPHTIAYIGKLLLGRFILPFEVISLVLLIAILGALVISKKGGPDE